MNSVHKERVFSMQMAGKKSDATNLCPRLTDLVFLVVLITVVAKQGLVLCFPRFDMHKLFEISEAARYR